MDTKTAHSPEPWRVSEIGDAIWAGDESLVCGGSHQPFRVDMSRIVACVNACAGIEDPAKAIAEACYELEAIRQMAGMLMSAPNPVLLDDIACAAVRARSALLGKAG